MMKTLNLSPYHIPELLAPAGEPDSFFGAVNAGADAVYLAGEKFGARAYAQNFDTETLIKCIQYAHLLDKKVYLTVNTLLKEDEIPQLYDYILPFYEAGLDAVIVQDLGVLKVLKTAFPDMEIHISTQMTICSEYGAKLLKGMGATRIVPARELSLDEIKTIKGNVDIEIETFIHGAMCYCYSGQCLFSSILGGRSGNRGRCAQPCRLPYQVKTHSSISREMYPLSLKDMCTIDHLPQLIEAGIDSFKIEGRMKKPEYAAGVTDIYRRAMDRYFELRSCYGVEEASTRYSCDAKDKKHLSSLYIRSEVHDGYYYKHNGKEMITLDSPSYAGGEEALLSSIQASFLQTKKRVPVEINARFLTGEPSKITLQCDGYSVTVVGDVVDRAKNAPLTEENIRKQLNKLGDTWYFANSIRIQMDDNVFYSLKALNELRREACDKLLYEMTGKYNRTASDTLQAQEAAIKSLQKEAINHDETITRTETKYAILISNLSQLRAVVVYLQKNNPGNVTRIYVESDTIVKHEEEMTAYLQTVQAFAEVWVALPYIFRKNAVKEVERLYQIHEKFSFSGILVRSMDELGYLQTHSFASLPIRCDAGVYTWNSEATKQLSEFTEGFTIPYELNSKEQGRLLNKANAPSYEKILYGRIPMMVTANCVLRTDKQCDPRNDETITLIDRYQKEFPVVRNCSQCYNIIYNSLPLQLPKPAKIRNEITEYRLNFTTEDEKLITDVLEFYLAAEGNNSPQSMMQEHTTGHEKRGVE